MTSSVPGREKAGAGWFVGCILDIGHLIGGSFTPAKAAGCLT